LICNNITFRRCSFTGATWAFNTANETQGCVVTESQFNILYQGVLLGDPTPVNGGPTGFRILGNSFDNIYAEGIKIAANTGLNASGYNVFYDVGNHFNGTTSPATSVINFLGEQNVSIGDMFERTAVYATTYPRININDGVNLAYESADQIKQGTYVRETGQSLTLVDNTAGQVITTFDATKIRAVQINYTIVRTVDIQTGVYFIVAGTDAAGTGLTGQDTSVNNGTGPGVTFAVSETASVVSWTATTSGTGNAGTIQYSITHLA
jgi:hypothetical protein